MTESFLVANTRKRKGRKHVASKIVNYGLLIFFALLVLIPFYVIIITSLTPNDEIATSVSFIWWPKSGLTFSAYYEILVRDATGGGMGMSSVLKGFLNTLWIVTPVCVLGLLLSSFSAYSFAKINFPGKNILFSLLLFTMMIPGVIMLVPSYLMYDFIGWTNGVLPLMIPGSFGTAACVFFMRQFFNGIPTELTEAAKIDGMNHFGIFFRIMVPLSKAALVSQFILGFLGGYNDYFGPLLYLGMSDIQTLQIALAMLKGTYTENWPTVMAGSVVALLPMLVIYFAAQQFFIEGIAMAGLKG